MKTIKLIRHGFYLLIIATGMQLMMNSNAFSMDVILPSGAVVATDFDSFSMASLNTQDGLFLGGYKLSNDGNNDPYIGFISKESVPDKYWKIEKGYVFHFFEHNKEVYVLLSTGVALKFNRDSFKEAEIKFKPKSIVIDNHPELIACAEGSKFKSTSSRLGSCYRLDGTWDTPLYWTQTNVPPLLCNDVIKVLVSSNKSRTWEVTSIDPKTGSQLSSKVVDKPEYKPGVNISVCEL